MYTLCAMYLARLLATEAACDVQRRWSGCWEKPGRWPANRKPGTWLLLDTFAYTTCSTAESSDWERQIERWGKIGEGRNRGNMLDGIGQRSGEEKKWERWKNMEPDGGKYGANEEIRNNPQWIKRERQSVVEEEEEEEEKVNWSVHRSSWHELHILWLSVLLKQKCGTVLVIKGVSY